MQLSVGSPKGKKIHKINISKIENVKMSVKTGIDKIQNRTIFHRGQIKNKAS